MSKRKKVKNLVKWVDLMKLVKIVVKAVVKVIMPLIRDLIDEVLKDLQDLQAKINRLDERISGGEATAREDRRDMEARMGARLERMEARIMDAIRAHGR